MTKLCLSEIKFLHQGSSSHQKLSDRGRRKNCCQYTLVGSQLDYCNSLFFEISKTNVNRLQLTYSEYYRLCRYRYHRTWRHHIRPII